MRKLTLLLAFFSAILLGGCSLLEGVNDSLEYANAAKDHINNLTNFGEQAPQLIQDAATNPEIKQDLENQLTTLKAEIEEFNNVEPPTIAEDLHQQLVSKNEAIVDAIDKAMVNGELALDKLENTELLNTINEITNMLNQIEKLGS